MNTKHQTADELAAEIYPNRLYLTKQVAELIGVSHRTMEHWRRYGRGPSISRLPGGAVRYRGSDLIAFLERCAS